MFQPGSTVRCIDAQDAPDLYPGQCYKVVSEEHRHLRLEGVDQLRQVDRFKAIRPIRQAEAIESTPITLPTGQGTLTLLRTGGRASGRRAVVHQGGRLLFDTDECHDEGNALHALDNWLAHVMSDKPIPF